MTAAVEFTPPALSQPLLRAVLRGGLRLLFRSLVRPPMPIALQRGVLRLLTAATPTPRGLSLTPGQIGGRPCEWHRPPEENGRVLLYLHGGAYLIGSPATHRGISATLAKLGQRATPCLTLSGSSRPWRCIARQARIPRRLACHRCLPRCTGCRRC